MKLITYLFFAFSIFTALYSYSQNATDYRKNSTSPKSSGKRSKPIYTSTSENISRPFYINTVISSTDSIAENRVIKVLGDDLSTKGFLFEVKNRWGNSIYECQSLNQMTTSGWDGKQNEILISIGLYSFVVRYQTTSGESFQKVGFITVQ